MPGALSGAAQGLLAVVVNLVLLVGVFPGVAGALRALSTQESPAIMSGGTTGGYWEVTQAGDVYSFGDAPFFGSAGDLRLAAPVVGMAATPDGLGYWLVGADGGVFSFGDARFFGSVPGLPVGERPPAGVGVVGLVPTPDGQGYWEVTQAGDVYSFGDAPFFGSAGDLRLAAPVVGMAATPDGLGYWLVGADGGVFSFGDARFFGSVPGLPVGQRPPAGVGVVGLVPSELEGASGTGTGTSGQSGQSATGTSGTGTSGTGTTGTGSQQSASDQPPVTILTSSLPPAVPDVNPQGGTPFYAPYQASLQASGGTAPYSWKVIQGQLPPGLRLQADGILSGDPLDSGTYRFTVQVTDSSDPPQVAQSTLSLTDPTLASGNWAGEVAVGSDLTGVQGTFTVPSLTTAATPPAQLGIWVGIDGWGDGDLIQAGVAEQPDASQPGMFDLYPWWEVLPAPATPIGSLTVAPGDRVTVSIDQLGSGSWQIRLVDDSTGQSFQTDQPYQGPMSSAEWIVEAPSDAQNDQVLPLAPFSPPVTFSSLAVDGSVAGRAATEIVQNGQVLAVPSGASSSGFTVTATAAASG